MSVDWIKKNVKVFSENLDLKTAQKIPGLRAVFGESYPDPVRVVTLEFDLQEIARDIDNPKWRSTSIEFCGGTCVKLFVSAYWSILILPLGTSPKPEISRPS
jgi:alanyl-tRNA synthetase